MARPRSITIGPHSPPVAMRAAADAPYHDHEDPTDRVFAYPDFRASLISGRPADYTCLVGTMTQEAFDTNPAVREACAASIFGHAETGA